MTSQRQPGVVSNVTVSPILELQSDMLELNENDLVALWGDLSGNGHSAIQIDSGAQPILQMIGGHLLVVPDGIDDWMDLGNFADNLDSFTIIVVMKPSGSSYPLITKLAVVFDYSYNGWSVYQNGGFQLQNNPANVSESYSNIIQQASIMPGEISVVTFEKISNTELHEYLNGVLNDVFDPAETTGVLPFFSTSESVKLFVEGGVDGADDSGYGQAPTAAVLIYTPALSQEDREAKEAELGLRYAEIPAYVSGIIDDNSNIVVRIDFSINVSANDFIDGVTIKINDVETVILSAERQPAREIVYFEVADGVVSGDTVTWEYTGGNIVSETHSIPLPNTSPQTVTNNLS